MAISWSGYTELPTTAGSPSIRITYIENGIERAERLEAWLRMADRARESGWQPKGSIGGRIESANDPQSKCWVCGRPGEPRLSGNPMWDGRIDLWQGNVHTRLWGHTFDCDLCEVRWSMLYEPFREDRPTLNNFRGAHP